jgi:hypothetical protein
MRHCSNKIIVDRDKRLLKAVVRTKGVQRHTLVLYRAQGNCPGSIFMDSDFQAQAVKSKDRAEGLIYNME